MSTRTILIIAVAATGGLAAADLETESPEDRSAKRRALDFFEAFAKKHLIFGAGYVGQFAS